MTFQMHFVFYLYSPGLGLMMAKALEANGAKRVYIIGRRWERLDAAAKLAVSKLRTLTGFLIRSQAV
jgi:NADP-dependent 3-hydroxy acid dehydrogenase YdfG